MANYGYVDTKNLLTIEAIEELLTSLNHSHFKGKLTWEREGTFYQLFWGEEKQYVREFEFTAKKFTMRHGGGSNFQWWIDTLIRHSVARKFEGIITDDGHGEKELGHPEKYLTYNAYLRQLWKKKWRIVRMLEPAWS